MIERGKRKTSKEDKIFQVLFFILTISLIGFLLISNLKIQKRRSELQVEIESLKKEIENLEEKKKELEAGISATEKESYWEEKIRQQGFVKEGENPVVVLPPQEPQEEKKIENQNLPEKFLKEIQDFFAGLVKRFNVTFPW